MQDGAQAVGVNGLGDVVVGAHAHGLHGAVDRALGRHHDHSHGLGVGGQFLQQFQAAHARHFHVGDNDGGRPGGNFFQSLRAIFRGFGPIAPAGDQFGQAGPLVLFVFDDQYFFMAHSGQDAII